MGKNLALAPISVGPGILMLLIMETLAPLPVTYFIATGLELVSSYILLCLFGNQISILLPMTVRAGTLRSSKTTFLNGLLHLAALILLLIAFIPIFIPLGIQYLSDSLGWARSVPVYLIFSAIQLGILGFLYSHLLEYQGKLLQTREQIILERVARKND